MTADVVCGQSNGKITLTATNGQVPYRYSMDGINYQASNVFTGLRSGIYTTMVRDNLGQIAFVNAEIHDNCPSVTAVTVDATCGNNDGKITATGHGGLAPYQYSIDGLNFQTGTVFSPLEAGAYTLTVKDAAGHTATTPVTITNTPGPAISVVQRNADCGGNGATLTIDGSGGAPAFQYSLDGINYQNSNILFPPVGPYQAYIKDMNGCVNSSGGQIVKKCLQLQETSTDPGCTNTDGKIKGLATKGIEPYTYSLDGSNYQTSPDFSGRAAGPYTITLKDDKGNTTTSGTTITAIPVLGILLTPAAASCAGNDGSLQISGSGGPRPYTYTLNGSSYGTGNAFNNLTTGPRLAALKDASGCMVSQTLTLCTGPYRPSQCQRDLQRTGNYGRGL